MNKQELINLVREELKGYSPQIGQTKGLTTDTMTKILTKIAKGDDYGSKPSKDNKFKTDIHLNKEEKELPKGKTPVDWEKRDWKLYETVSYSKPNFDVEWKEAERYPEFVEMGKEQWMEKARIGKPVLYSQIKDILGNVDLNFDGLEKPKKQRFQAAFQKGSIEMPIAVKFSDDDYDLVAGNTRLSGLVKNGIDPKIWTVDLSDIHENSANDTDIFKFEITDQLYDEEDDSLLAVEYKFSTSEDTYRVEFHSGEYNSDDKIFDLAFGLDREGFYKLDTFQMTGKGQVKKILKTITAIIQDFLTEFDVEKVNIFPTDEKRRRVFKAIIGSIPKVKIHENYADGKVKGKSRPGRVKKAGVNCSKSITDLRKLARNSTGEKEKMAHWCANMKSGRKK